MSTQRPAQTPEHGLDLRVLQPRDYSRYFFPENPFPAIPVAEENPTFIVDRSSIIKLIRDTIVSSVSTDRSQTVVLQGIYGSGKSHILKYVKASINSQLSDRPKGRALAVYVESPRSSFRNFYSGIVSGLGMGVLKELAGGIVSTYLSVKVGSLQPFLIKTTSVPSGQEIAQRFRSNPSYLGDIIDRLKYLDLFRDVLKTHEKHLKIRDSLTALLQLLVPVNETTAWRWLLGEPLAKQEREKLSVTYEIEDENALDATEDLLYMFRTGGYQTLFILLDELEDIVDLHATKRSRYFSDLRHFIDRNTAGICLIAGVTATGFSEIRASGHPLERRLLQVNEILGKFDQAKTGDLVVAYLQDSRKKLFGKNKEKESELNAKVQSLGDAYEVDLFPFTRQVVATVYERGDGNVGNILSIFHKLVDGACDRNLETISDVGLVDTILAA